jgi:hypothetical protein
MPENTFLRNMLGGGSKEYFKSGKREFLHDRAKDSLTEIRKKDTSKRVGNMGKAMQKARVISSGKEASLNQVPMKMFARKY